MKTKKYLYGKFFFKAYYKAVGHGYEVGLTYGKKPIFVGNFLHKKEAMKWWATLNKECKTFTKRYWINKNVSATWYCKFFSAHLYKTYYSFLDKLFANYKTTYTRHFNTDHRRYKTLQKKWSHKDAPIIRAA